jgi:putative peptidoglycan lipid II flippase
VLYLLPVSLFGQSIAAASLPALARVSAAATPAELGARTRRALSQTGFLNLPVAMAYLSLGPVLAAALYRLLPGRFGEPDAWLVGLVLGAYALGLPAATGARVLQSTFFALGDTRTPARAAALRVSLGAVLAVPGMLALDRVPLVGLPGLAGLGGGLRLGAVGLALGASAAAWLEWSWLTRSLGRRVPDFHWRRPDALRVLAASAAGAVAGWAVCFAMRSIALPPVAIAAAVGAAFLAAFVAVGLAARVPQLERVRRRLPGGRS